MPDEQFERLRDLRRQGLITESEYEKLVDGASLNETHGQGESVLASHSTQHGRGRWLMIGALTVVLLAALGVGVFALISSNGLDDANGAAAAESDGLAEPPPTNSVSVADSSTGQQGAATTTALTINVADATIANSIPADLLIGFPTDYRRPQYRIFAGENVVNVDNYEIERATNSEGQLRVVFYIEGKRAWTLAYIRDEREHDAAVVDLTIDDFEVVGSSAWLADFAVKRPNPVLDQDCQTAERIAVHWSDYLEEQEAARWGENPSPDEIRESARALSQMTERFRSNLWHLQIETPTTYLDGVDELLENMSARADTYSRLHYADESDFGPVPREINLLIQESNDLMAVIYGFQRDSCSR